MRTGCRGPGPPRPTASRPPWIGSPSWPKAPEAMGCLDARRLPGVLARRARLPDRHPARPGRSRYSGPDGSGSGQLTFSALLSSKKLVFPPATSVAVNLRVMAWPMYEARLVVYSTYLLPLFAAVATATVWTTVPEEFRTSRTSLFAVLVVVELTSTQ